MAENESGHVQSVEGPGARSKPLDLKAKSLEHTDIQIAQRRWVARIEGQILSMLEAAAGQQNGEVLHIVIAGVAQVAAEEHHAAIQQRFTLFLGCVQLL